MSGWVSLLTRGTVHLSGRRIVPALAGVCAAAALAVVYWTALSAPAVGAFHDDGIYAVTAKALATGRGYRILSLPGEMPQTKYPILFPTLVAAVWSWFPAFPDNAIWLKAVPLGCALVWWALTYRLVKRETQGRTTSLLLVLMVVASPWVLFLSTALLSETLFAALASATLLVVGRIERGHDGPWEVTAAALLAGAAFLTRTGGVALVAASGIALARRGYLRQTLGFLLIAAAVCTPWLWWQASQPAAPPGPDAYYSQANYQSWNVLGNFTWDQKMLIVTENLLGGLIAPAALAGVPAAGWGAALALLLGVLAAAGFALRIWRGPGAVEIFMLLYGGLVVLWAWPPLRFFTPVLPILLLYAWEGLWAACSNLKLHASATSAIAAGLATVLLASSAWSLADTVAHARTSGTIKLPNTAQDDWREIARLAEWIRRSTPQDAVLMGNLDPVLYLYTGRKAVRGFVADPYQLHYAGGSARPLGTADEMLDTIRKYHVRYLICTPNAAFREGKYLERLDAELVWAHPDLFHLRYRSGGGAYRAYQVTLRATPRPI
jgi:hypothetical protein